VCREELGTIVRDGDGEALVSAVVTALQRRWNRDAIRTYGSARDWGQVAAEVHAVLERVVHTARAAQAAIDAGACWQPAGGAA
jgi:uncharacterized protein YukE